MSPINEPSLDERIVTSNRESLENYIIHNRSRLLDNIKDNIEPLLSDNTMLIREYLKKFCAEVDREIKESSAGSQDWLKTLKESLPQFHQIEKDIIDALPALDKARREVREMLPQWKIAIETAEVDPEFLNTMNAKISETSEMINGVKNNIEALQKLNPWDARWRSSTAPNDAINFYEQNLERSLKVPTPMYPNTPDDEFRSGVITALKKGIEDLEAFNKEKPPHESNGTEVTDVGYISRGKDVPSPSRG